LQAEHPANNIPPAANSNTAIPDLKIPKYLKLLTGLLLIMSPVGIFMMFTGYGRQFLWTTTLFLGLQAVIMFLVLVRLAGFKKTAVTALIILIASFFTEWWGSNTGLPFGHYTYTDVLMPQIYGVPVAITFAWFAVTSSSFITVKYLLWKVSVFTVVFVSAVFVLATDILLEPFAAFVNNFWRWDTNQIPMQNFAAWLGLGMIFSIIMIKILKWKREFRLNDLYVPAIIICINVLNFSIVNIANGYYILTVVGLGILAVIVFSALFIKLNIK
jgi:putative membrane protein